jgi:hypothetical protein
MILYQFALASYQSQRCLASARLLASPPVPYCTPERKLVLVGDDDAV